VTLGDDDLNPILRQSARQLTRQIGDMQRLGDADLEFLYYTAKLIRQQVQEEWDRRFDQRRAETNRFPL
jgi:hypothetical protein